jgi:hypothetical protein
MKTFDFMQGTISHNVKDPYSKALEPDCLSPLLAITTQSHQGEEIVLVYQFFGKISGFFSRPL